MAFGRSGTDTIAADLEVEPAADLEAERLGIRAAVDTRPALPLVVRPLNNHTFVWVNQVEYGNQPE